MILRAHGDGLLATGQAAHAWISGQMARAWGSDPFGPFEPREEVILAAASHDLGLMASDADARVVAGDGPPMGFLDMPVADHMRVWAAAPRLALQQSRYLALLVSLHATYLYGFRDLSSEPRLVADGIRAFLADQERFREGVVRSFSGDSWWAPFVADDVLARNQRLVATWDAMSLALCLGALPWTVPGVPCAEGVAAVALSEGAGGLNGGIEGGLEGDAGVKGGIEGGGSGGVLVQSVVVDPWPFRGDFLAVSCDARRIGATFADDDALRAALDSAPWITLRLALRPVA